jgi:hypothetical protein
LARLKGGREAAFIVEDSIAAEYAWELCEWLPEATQLRLVARHEGRDLASVNAFIDAAKGRSKTITFVKTENGGSICGGYLDVAWVEGGFARDPGMMSFIFTLRNHLGVPPTKFAQKRGDCAAYMRRHNGLPFVYFGQFEGFIVYSQDCNLSIGQAYEAPSDGVTLFCGDGSRVFRAGRWELWDVC